MWTQQSHTKTTVLRSPRVLVRFHTNFRTVCLSCELDLNQLPWVRCKLVLYPEMQQGRRARICMGWQLAVKQTNSPCSLIVQNTAPASCIYFCCSRPRHIWPISGPNILMWFVRDSFRFAWSSFGFFSVWKQTKPQGKATSLQTRRLIQTRVNKL